MFRIILAITILTAAARSDDPHLLFHASYDDGFDADHARGQAKATVLSTPEGIPAPELVEGVKGRAAKVLGGGLNYALPGNLELEAGTIEFWLKPVDWDGTDDLMHFFFSTNVKPKGHMIIYRYLRTKKPKSGIFGKLAFYLRGGLPEDEKHSLVIPHSTVSDKWKRGQWHHVAGTWGKREARLYVDGILVGSGHGKLPSDRPDFFSVSANNRAKGGVGNVIDEFRIHSRGLALEEILAHYVAGKRTLVLREAASTTTDPEQLGKSLQVAAVFQNSLRELFVRVDATSLPLKDLPGLRVAVMLEAPSGRPAIAAKQVSISELCMAQTSLPAGTIAPGTYNLECRVLGPSQDKVLAVHRSEITRPEADWLENDLGLGNEPVPPFEPVRIEDGRISVWGKTYELGNRLLLQQATVRPDPNAGLHKSVKTFWHDASLLAKPIRIAGTFDGEEIRLDTGKRTQLDAQPAYATFDVSCRQDPVAARTVLRFDDDSIVTAEIALETVNIAEIRDLRIEIPLKSRYCRWMNWTSLDGGRSASGAGAIPDGEGIVWQGPFHPLLWVGDDYRGFGYFFDNSRGWQGDLTAPDRVQIRRTGQTTTVVLRLVPKGCGRPQPWQTKISFLATPAKPMPPKWRGTELGGNFRIRHIPYRESCPRHVVYWWTTAFFEDGQNHFSSPRTDTIRLDAIREAIAKNGDKPISHVFYTYANSYRHPVVRHFYSDWCNKSTDDLLSMLSQPEAPMSVRVDWNTSIRDWWLTQMDKLADLGVDGIYSDDPYTHPSFNHRTGTAFVAPDGEVRPNYGLYGLR